MTETTLDRDPPGQRTPWTETPVDTDPLDRDPPDRDPLDRDLPRQKPSGQKPPVQTNASENITFPQLRLRAVKTGLTPTA